MMRMETALDDDPWDRCNRMKGNDVIETATTEKRVAVAREYVDRVFNGHNGELVREYFTPDFTFHALTVGTLTGVRTALPVLGGLIQALPELPAEAQPSL